LLYNQGDEIMSLVIADDLLYSIGLSEKELLTEIAVMLFQQERVSLGKASKIANMNYVEFQELLAKRNISLHYDVEEFEEDIKTLKETGWL
jgi:predicted HTH domain antitoxin